MEAHLSALDVSILCLHLSVDVLHCDLRFETLIILLFLLFSVKLIRLNLLQAVLVVLVDDGVEFGFVHNFMERLGQHKALEVLLVYLFLSLLGLL